MIDYLADVRRNTTLQHISLAFARNFIGEVIMLKSVSIIALMAWAVVAVRIIALMKGM
jgi:hypothetical protein